MRGKSRESVEQLQHDRFTGCFDYCTNSDVFHNSCDSLDEFTDTITSCVSFCVDSVVPVKRCKMYANNKPWVSKQLKEVLNKTKRVYFQGGVGERKVLQREVKNELKKARLIPQGFQTALCTSGI